jgi:hypothetical protein
MSQGLSDSLAPIFYFFSVPFRNPWRYRADVLHDRAELRFRRVPNTGHPSASDQASRRILILLRRKYLCSLRQIILRVLHLEEELMSSISRVNLGSLTKIGKDELQSLKARMVRAIPVSGRTVRQSLQVCDYTFNKISRNVTMLCCKFPSRQLIESLVLRLSLITLFCLFDPPAVQTITLKILQCYTLN